MKRTKTGKKLMLDTKPQIQEAQRAPHKINASKTTLGISFSNYRKSKIKKNPERSQRKKTTSLIEKKR